MTQMEKNTPISATVATLGGLARGEERGGNGREGRERKAKARASICVCVLRKRHVLTRLQACRHVCRQRHGISFTCAQVVFFLGANCDLD